MNWVVVMVFLIGVGISLIFYLRGDPLPRALMSGGFVIMLTLFIGLLNWYESNKG